MGKDLFEGNASARAIYEHADQLLGFPLTKICFEGPDEALKQTKNTQPAIFLHSYMLTTLLDSAGVVMSAGHSLGEYSALVFAGAISFEDGLRVVRLRGELMQRAGETDRGTMAAIIGLEPQSVERICLNASASGIVQCANFNSPGQIVISGTLSGVHRAMELAKSAGAKMVKELVVSGAFHSPLMASAQLGLKEALEQVKIHDARIPVFANVTAQPVQKGREIRTLLEAQVTQPVRWAESVMAMAAAGADAFVEVGPGKVLQGLVKRITPELEVRNIDTYDQIDKLAVGQ